MELLFPRVKYVYKAAPVTIRAAPVTIRAAPVTGTNRTGHVETETAPPWEDEDTEAGEVGEVVGHIGGRDRQATGGQAGGRAEATTGGEGPELHKLELYQQQQQQQYIQEEQE